MSQSAAQYTEWKQYLPRNFPIGIRALLVENDRACMETMQQTLIRAQFEVKACYKAIEAVSLLREKKESFDIIISDVHMPGMDGFELLQLVSLETNLPFILISADDRLNVMMRGLSLGATDYLIKPLRIEDLRHVWKHIAKTRLGDKEAPKYMMHDSLVNEEPKGSSNSKRKRTADNLNDNDDNNNDEDEPNNDGSSSKRTHMVWTSELQQKFLRAVNQVGIDKVGPNKILELMNAPGVTRKNVASHLQKYRAHWKKLDKAQQSEIIRFANASAARTAQRENLNFPPLCAPYQIPAQTRASLESEILGRPSGSLSGPPMGLQQTSMQGRPLMDCQTNMFNRFPHSKVADSNNHLGGLNSSHRAINMQISQHPFSSQELNIFQGGENPVLLNQNSMEAPTRLLNSSPAQSNSVLMNQNSMLVPSQPQFRFQAGNTPVSSNGNSWYDNGSTNFYHGLLSSQPTGIGRRLDENFSNVAVFSGSTIPGSTSSSVPPCAVGSMPLQMSNICNTQDPGIVFGTSPGHEPEESFGFLDKDPNEYLCDDIESPTNLG